MDIDEKISPIFALGHLISVPLAANINRYMAQIKTAREVLAWIEKSFFKKVKLAAASSLKGEERREFVLSQVERLLTEMYGSVPVAMRLSDEFWTADEGRKPIPWEGNALSILKPGYRTNPLLSLKEQQTLTSDEMGRSRLIMEVAGLCHDLTLHFEFDMKEAFGIRGKFWVSNKKLVEWLTTTKYERIAMHTAYTLKKVANSEYCDMNYQPAQDATAEIFSGEYSELVREPNSAKMPPRAYVKTILDALAQIERHWQRGRRLKLHPEVVILHDEIWGFVPSRIDKDVLEAALVLYDYMDKNVRGRMHHEGYTVSQWKKMPEEMRCRITDTANAFVDKVREVREKYLGKGWVADRSLEINYLVTHAERIGGYWDYDEDEVYDEQ